MHIIVYLRYSDSDFIFEEMVDVKYLPQKDDQMDLEKLAASTGMLAPETQQPKKKGVLSHFSVYQELSLSPFVRGMGARAQRTQHQGCIYQPVIRYCR